MDDISANCSLCSVDLEGNIVSEKFIERMAL